MRICSIQSECLLKVTTHADHSTWNAFDPWEAHTWRVLNLNWRKSTNECASASSVLTFFSIQWLEQFIRCLFTILNQRRFGEIIWRVRNYVGHRHIVNAQLGFHIVARLRRVKSTIDDFNVATVLNAWFQYKLAICKCCHGLGSLPKNATDG